jgi:hypothetical protein
MGIFGVREHGVQGWAKIFQRRTFAMRCRASTS